ncbi:uncharacterized protein EV154DRAFT_485842 [Mucor mucedo]|uniref:uncharacterized protein n=1 Tax=Mucor mucedo TaxID=29922 RepID=UPI00221F87DF|nr:uncharacterized protein EV154DRAFT_485842 [Mucor mucedo]KAI7880895.1 hypothetical protein EV154DRAFT_485842 [Mucor mucedo]
MAEKLHNSWATIASRGNSKKVVRPLSVPNNVDSQLKLQTYKLIETQCGPFHGFRPISNYGSSLDGDHLIEAKFVDDSSFDKAIFTCVTIKSTVIKGTHSNDSELSKLAHVKISLLYILDRKDFLEKLTRSLLVYGEVLQVKEYTCGGYFEGELSVILDTTTGAPIVCHWCHHAGQVRSKCPELAKTKCFACQGYGHTAKFYKKKTFKPVQVNTPKEESNIELPTFVEQSMSDSDTDLSDAYQPSKIAESGSSTSKYATTLETVCMEIEEDEGTLPVTVQRSHLAGNLVDGGRKMLGQKRSILGKQKAIKQTFKGPAPKLVVQTQHALKSHKMFTKTKVAKPK